MALEPSHWLNGLCGHCECCGWCAGVVSDHGSHYGIPALQKPVCAVADAQSLNVVHLGPDWSAIGALPMGCACTTFVCMACIQRGDLPNDSADKAFPCDFP
jgi:hypothetical protein